VLKTLQAIDESNVAILVIDASAGISEQDASLSVTRWKPEGRWWLPSTNGTR